MKNIQDIDTNFYVETTLDIQGLKYRNAREEPFKIYGVFYENGAFRRMPENIAKRVSEKVEFLHSNTAGGRIRFATDSSYVAIKATIESPSRMSHFPLTGTTGFDLYSDEDGRSVYIGTFVPPYDIGTSYESLVKFGGEKMREITIHMPLYANVTELYIGIDENATLKASTPYEHERPAVFYGSSVTQGGCASRPGNSYEAVLSRELSLDHVNLGFSGGAKAEDEMIEYLASYLKEINASLFVLDYDYNSPSKEHLEATHEKAFKRIREVNRSLPILILSRPKYRLSYDERLRREIIRRTYENAVNSGDKNVYFIDGVDLMELCREDGTVDNCHPTDFGFASMAAKIKPLLASIIDN